MVVGEMPEAVDLVVIGAGPGGYTAALAAAADGRSVTLVDRRGADGVGGVCLLEGCIPSKALIELGTARHDERRRTAMGLTSSGAAVVDLARFQTWKRSVIASLGDGVRGRLSRAGVEIVRGTAVFTGPRSLRVEREGEQSRILEFDHALIASGSVPSSVPVIDERDPRVVDAAGVLDLESLPKNVVVVGGGYIGVELGTALRKLGSAVTLVEAAESVLPSLDRRLGADVATGLRELGVQVRAGVTVAGLDEVGVVLDVAGARDVVPADAVVVATGRRPASDGMQLDRAGVKMLSSGHVHVDARLMATERIAAIGDVVEGPGLAHKATAEARIAVDSLAGRPAEFDQLVPLVVFSDPEVAYVGLSLDDAHASGIDARETSAPLASIGKPLVLQQGVGGVRLVYDAESKNLLGGSVSGPHATELIAEVTVAVEAGLQIGDVAGSIHAHPTLSELVAEAALQVSLD